MVQLHPGAPLAQAFGGKTLRRENRNDQMLMSEHPRRYSEQNQARTGLNQVRPTGRLGAQNRNDLMQTAVMTEVDPVETAMDVIRSLLMEMADEPDEIQIHANSFGLKSVNLVVKTGQTDYGRILGKEQKNLLGLKSICKVLSGQKGEDKTDIQITMDQRAKTPEGEKKKRAYVPIDSEFSSRERIRELFQNVFEALFDGEARVVVSGASDGATEIAVAVSNRANPRTAEWLPITLASIVTTICSRNGRRPASLKIVRDQMIYEQLCLES
jgi:predicted RNA-binding protein YlqC (UPF0109 family)